MPTSEQVGSDPAFEARAARAVREMPGMWWYEALQVRAAHEHATGRGVTIALINGPIDPSVPDLRGQRVVPAQGYCSFDRRPEVARGRVARHTTAMAALMVGSGRGNGPGGVGVAGIAPDATVRVYSVYDRLLGKEHLDSMDCRVSTGEPFSTLAASAIRDAVDDGARVICIPMGFPATLGMKAAIRFAQQEGVVLVAAAGNEGSSLVSYPASEQSVVAVGAVDRQAQVWTRSNRGGGSVVTAPGVRISSGRYVQRQWDSAVTNSGTSGASALTAGAMALVVERYPEATGWQLLRHIAYRSGGDKRLNWSSDYGFGIVALNRMLTTDPARWRNEDPFADYGSQYFIGSEDDELTGPEPSASPSEEPKPAQRSARGSRSETDELGWVVPVAAGGGGLAVLGAVLASVVIRRRVAGDLVDNPAEDASETGVVSGVRRM